MANSGPYTGFFQPDYLPPTAFYFTVKFNGTEDMDSGFQEVSGLELTFGSEEKMEGGDNSSVLILPKAPTFSPLVLKRCLMPNSALDTWCRNAFENFLFDPKDIQLALIGADGIILASWSISKAYPWSWKLSDLNSTSNALAIETLTLKYRSFKREEK